MPEQSGFASAVGGFLQGYGTVKQMQLADAESRRRDQEAKDAALARKIELDRAGYSLVDLTPPSVQRHGFLAKVGSFLSGGTDTERTLVPIKDHESADEANRRIAADNARALESQREGFETSFHAADNATRITEANIREAGDDRRSAASNATQRYVADRYAGSAQLGRAIELRNRNIAEKEKAIDDAIAAASTVSANGTIDANRAYNAIPLVVRQKYGIGAADMNAGLVRFRDRKPALTREAIAQRDRSAAARKGSSWLAPPAATSDAARTVGGDPTATMSDADAWEYWTKHGLSPDQATARVKARR